MLRMLLRTLLAMLLLFSSLISQTSQADGMKFVRYGEKGSERPGLVDAAGKLRDLSAHLEDITPATIG